jgi:hypothetical protein
MRRMVRREETKQVNADVSRCKSGDDAIDSDLVLSWQEACEVNPVLAAKA